MTAFMEYPAESVTIVKKPPKNLWFYSFGACYLSTLVVCFHAFSLLRIAVFIFGHKRKDLYAVILIMQVINVLIY